ncbi:P-loop containing nucleoside triphosphate hydrolase protein [Mycena rebaudengoi]|nr:P-loop containing nucleoside triphosphate hydrolase protein [Mycena rebaudengoi]
MPTTANGKNIIQYTILAATTAKNIAETAKVPFLGSTVALTLSILKCIEATRLNKEDYVEIMEQIHEILCTIVQLHATSEIKGVLPMALLYDIAKFTEALEKLLTVLSRQQKGPLGKIKGIFRQSEGVERLETCKQELSRIVQLFRAQVAGSTLSQMRQMRKDAREQHEQLVALLETHSDLTGSDCSSVIGTLASLKNNSSGSFGLLPPCPQIFHGREAELQHVVNILMQESSHIAILGAGGMGKTSLAMAALVNPQVETKYTHRYFVPCHSSPTCTELAMAIADHIGLEKSSNMTTKIAHYFAHAPPSLLVLDNVETPWESLSSRSEVEEFLSLLTDAPHLGLMITLRGAERPRKVKWTRPFLAPLGPLSYVAARQTFIEVADGGHDDASIKELLELTGNLPLAVSLIASVAGSEGCAQALSRWKLESTQMLSEGYDQRSSLDISIMLSYTSSRMTSGARELLSILSMLPDGLTDADLVQAKLPIIDILACKTTLIQTSLAFLDPDQHLKMLVPIREHILHIHPPANALKLKLREHFHQILDLWNQFKNFNVGDILPQMSQNLGNFNIVLLDGLESQGPDILQTFRSILFLNGFYDRVHNTYSPLLLHSSWKMSHWEDHPILGEYLIDLVETSQYLPHLELDSDITLGTQHFNSKDPLDQDGTVLWEYTSGGQSQIRQKPSSIIR